VIDDPHIGSLRDKIDSIDRQLLELLRERLEVVHQVGQEKLEKGLAVFDPNREEALLMKLISIAPSNLDERAIRVIFTAIVAESRRLESEAMSSPSESTNHNA
jgi:chorismate mutase